MNRPVATLFFSALGDIVLALPIKNSVILRLGAFLIAHLGYILSMVRTSDFQFKVGAKLALIVGYFGIVSIIMLPNSGKLWLPVLIYMLVVLAMVYYTSVFKPLNIPLLSGASLFVLSDTLIAINKFVVAEPAEERLIMTTYYLAQLLLVHGFIW